MQVIDDRLYSRAPAGVDAGHEGAVMFKANGKYYLGAADSYEGRYSTCMAISDNVWGPYKMRFEAITLPIGSTCTYAALRAR